MDCTTSHLSQTRPCDLLHQDSGGLRIPEKLHEFGSTTHLTGAPDAMDRTTGLQCGLGGMPAPEQIISHGISPMGSGFAAGLVWNLTVIAFGTTRADVAGLAITEATASRTTVRETPVIGATPLKALVAIAAILKTPIARAPIVRTSLFGAPAFKTPVAITSFTITSFTITAIIGATAFKATIFKTAVIRTALFKAPVPITTIATAWWS